MSTAAGGREDEVLVGRCYTKARRHPLMIGKWPGGQRPIWGGPYTVPQVVVIAVVFAVLMLTRGVWAHFGLVNFVIAVGVPYGMSLVVRHVHIDGRNPLLVALSAGGAVAAPASGRLRGRPVKPVGRHRPLVGVCSVTWAQEAPDHVRVVTEAASSVVGVPSVAATAAGQPTAVVAGRPVAAAAALLALRQERSRAASVDDERGV